ncbi:MAG: hypothetical protein GXO76_15120 [Calditrichaeota bacterium]|nr:hypothetical protein [Calditrichota bacterium]
MKKTQWIVVAFLLLWTACSQKPPSYPGGQAEYHFFKIVSQKVPILNPDKDAVLVKSTAFQLRVSDIRPEVYQKYGIFADPPEKISKKELDSYLRNLISQETEERLFVAEAKRVGITFPQDSVDHYIQGVIQTFGGKEATEKDLATRGLTLKLFRDNYWRKNLYRKYLKDVVYKNLSVDEKEIRDFYNGWESASFRLFGLSFKGDSPSEKSKIRQKMETYLKKARAGENFGNMVKQFSGFPYRKNQGGLFKDFPRTHMPGYLQEAVSHVDEGKVSDIFESDDGYFLILKLESRKKYTQPLKDVKADIKDYLLYFKKNKAYKAAVKSLKKTYKVTSLWTPEK